VPDHISRKDLKKDEFRETIEHGAEAILLHQKATIYIVVIVAVALGAYFGARLYTERQTVKAAAGYDDAMKVFNAHVRTAGEPSEPGELTYADDKSKYEDAAKKFETVAKQYSHTRPGEMAAYYEGLSLEHLKKNNEAAVWFEQVSHSGEDDFASLARLELAQIDDEMNKSSDAEKLYKDLVAHPTVFVSKPVALMGLASHYRGLKNNAEAVKIYNEIKTEYPDSPLAQEAAQDIAML